MNSTWEENVTAGKKMFKIVGSGHSVENQPGYQYEFTYSAFIWAFTVEEAIDIYNRINGGAVFQTIFLSNSEALYVEEEYEAKVMQTV
jgi:hypothetical protein